MELVYGEVADSLVFLPRSKALVLHGIHLALESSKTWGELKLAVPIDLYRGLVARFREDAELDEDDDEDAPDTYAGDEVDLLADWEPDSTATLDYFKDLIGDGDFPDWPEQDALAWMPKDIQHQFGTVVDSTLNGDYLELAPAHEHAIVAALAAHGYQCARDDDLVRGAKGM
jgi:hypothetical protein